MYLCLFVCLSVQNFGAYSGISRILGSIVNNDGISIQLQIITAMEIVAIVWPYWTYGHSITTIWSYSLPYSIISYIYTTTTG